MKSWKCSMKNCKQYEMLPQLCGQCKKLFCKDHANEQNHKCQQKSKTKNATILANALDQQKSIDSNESEKKVQKIKKVSKKLLQFEVESHSEAEIQKVASDQTIKTLTLQQSEKKSTFNEKSASISNLQKKQKPWYSIFLCSRSNQKKGKQK